VAAGSVELRPLLAVERPQHGHLRQGLKFGKGHSGGGIFGKIGMAVHGNHQDEVSG
jgi:hypothetical protein